MTFSLSKVKTLVSQGFGHGTSSGKENIAPGGHMPRPGAGRMPADNQLSGLGRGPARQPLQSAENNMAPRRNALHPSMGQARPAGQSSHVASTAQAPRPASPANTPENRALRGQVMGMVESYVTDKRRTGETRERPLAAMEALDRLSGLLTSPRQLSDHLTELKTLLRTSNSAKRNAGLQAFADKATRLAASIERARAQPQPQPQPRPQATAAPQFQGQASGAQRNPAQGQVRQQFSRDDFMRHEMERAEQHHERPDYTAAENEYRAYKQRLSQKEQPSPTPSGRAPAPARGEPRAQTPQAAQRPLEDFNRDAEDTARYRSEQPNYAQARRAHAAQSSSASAPTAPAPLPGQAGRAVQEFRAWMSTAGFGQRFGSAGRNLMSDALAAVEQHGAKLPPAQLHAVMKDLSRIVGESANNPMKLGQLRTFTANVREASRAQAQSRPDLDLKHFMREEQARARYHSEVPSHTAAENAYRAYLEERPRQ